MWILTYFPPGLTRACPALRQVCRRAHPSRVTYDDPDTTHSPFFWCEECFQALHCDAGGALRQSGFRVFPYAADFKQELMPKSRQYTKAAG
jgi:hypothetical protein